MRFVTLSLGLVVACGSDSEAIDAAPAAPDDAAGIDAQLSCDELQIRWWEETQGLRGCESVRDCRIVFEPLYCDDGGYGPSCGDVVNGDAYDGSHASDIAREWSERGCSLGFADCAPVESVACVNGTCTASFYCCGCVDAGP